MKTAEHERLDETRRQKTPWKKWGPYLSERQWGTVREDYSEGGNAWDYFTHDQARSRAYRWGEDGLAGISDNQQRLCFALALWNGKDPILKERLFGLTNSEEQPWRGRQGILLLPRQHADALVHEVPLQVSAGGFPLRRSRGDKPRPQPQRVRIRTARHRCVQRQSLLRRVRGIRQSTPGRHLDPDHHPQPRSRGGRVCTCCPRCGSATLVVDRRIEPSGRATEPEADRSRVRRKCDRSAASLIGRLIPVLRGDTPLLFTENETNNERIFPDNRIAAPMSRTASTTYVVHGTRRR